MGEGAPGAPQIVRFASFELDLRSGELRRNGSRVGLQDQPLQILSLLFPGRVEPPAAGQAAAAQRPESASGYGASRSRSHSETRGVRP
jgi:hypothetical protein